MLGFLKVMRSTVQISSSIPGLPFRLYLPNKFPTLSSHKSLTVVRPPMKKTTSMTGFTLDFNGQDRGVNNQQLDPGHNRFNGADLVETADFLRVCSLCKSRLIHGRDIYMYRGDTAFCSTECRQHQMTKDEKKEKRSLQSKREIATAAGVNVFATAETVAAV